MALLLLLGMSFFWRLELNWVRRIWCSKGAVFEFVFQMSCARLGEKKCQELPLHWMMIIMVFS